MRVAVGSDANGAFDGPTFAAGHPAAAVGARLDVEGSKTAAKRAGVRSEHEALRIAESEDAVRSVVVLAFSKVEAERVTKLKLRRQALGFGA